MENQHSDLIEKTRKEIKELLRQEKIISENIILMQRTLSIVRNRIDKLYENFPKCYSCGKNQDPRNMIIATKEDIDNYICSNEGYCGPEVGEYYCFC